MLCVSCDAIEMMSCDAMCVSCDAMCLCCRGGIVTIQTNGSRVSLPTAVSAHSGCDNVQELTKTPL